MLLEAGHGLVDPRGRLLPKFYDVLGCVSVSWFFHLVNCFSYLATLFKLEYLYPLVCSSLNLYYFAGLYTTFIFQKPDPDVTPPLMTPLLHEGTQILDEVSFSKHTLFTLVYLFLHNFLLVMLLHNYKLVNCIIVNYKLVMLDVSQIM